MPQDIERREFLKKAGTLFLAIQEPAAVRILASILPVGSLSNSFPWTRNEVLFGPNAGFEEIRRGEAVGVWADPSLQLDLAPPIQLWNKMAHQTGRDDLFKIEYDPDKIRVSFLPDSKTIVENYPSYTDPYENCVVRWNSGNDLFTAAHELGHTLGFVDFVTGGTNTRALPHINPQRCDLSGKQINSIMAYCDWLNFKSRFGEDDKNLLKVAGYA